MIRIVPTAPIRDALPDAASARIARRRQLRRRMLGTIAGSYAFSTAILLLYAGAGTTSLRVPMLYALAGGLVSAEKGAWNQLEAYISSRIDVIFSHGICAECRRTQYPGFPPRVG